MKRNSAQISITRRHTIREIEYRLAALNRMLSHLEEESILRGEPGNLRPSMMTRRDGPAVCSRAASEASRSEG